MKTEYRNHGMKSKTIRKILQRKIEDWVSTIEDESLRTVVKNNAIVTGGSIASMLLGERVNDFDVYLRTQEAARRVAEYYVDRFQVKDKRGIPLKISVQSDPDRVRVVIKSAGIASEEGTDKEYEYFEMQPDDSRAGDYVGDVMDDPGEIQDTHEELRSAVPEEEEGKPRYRPVFLSTNAISLSNSVQVVLRFFGDPDTIHENYDYVHCTNHWQSWDDNLVLRQDALEALLARELRYVGSKYPICSLFRLRKFIARGWRVNAGQVLKIAIQVSDLDLKNYEVLQDQLTGVDVAYFAEVLSKIKSDDPEKINSAYLIEIVDRMF